MGRIQTAFVSGTISDNPLTVGATTLNSAGLSSLAAVVAPNIAAIVLDPAGIAGAPEIVWVTAHTAAATSATIVRAKEGTAARQHAVGIPWVHGPTLLDYEAAMPEWLEVMSTAGDTSTNGVHPSSNAAYLTPLRPLTADVTIQTIVGSIGVQSGNVDVGVYEWDGTTMTLITSLGSTACPAAATRVVYNIADAVLYKGTRYYFAYAADNGTVSYSRITYSAAVIAPSGTCLSKAASFPLPATITSLTNQALGPHLYGSVSGGATI